MIETKQLPLLTQLTFEQLLNNETSKHNINNKRYQWKKKGDIKGWIELGLALQLYTDTLNIKETL